MQATTNGAGRQSADEAVFAKMGESIPLTGAPPLSTMAQDHLRITSMKLLLRVLIVCLAIGGVTAAAYPYARSYWKARNAPKYRLAEVVRGDLVSDRGANGTVQPVLSVRVGSFVSGPIKALYVDFNSEVKKDDLLAEIDPQLYEAAVARDEAYLATQQAQVARTRATLQQAINDEKRAEAFRARNKSYVSEAEMDRLKFSREAIEAELALAEASVRQAEASLRNSRANLGYTKIRSPVDGTVIDRKIDPGQTLAAQFQTPEMFIVAPDMEKKMHVLALVDEADIGLIRAAKDRNEEVEFTVDAYPDELFKGTIYQIRVSPNTLQNVVTYTVVVEAPNPGRKLLPGMTAELTFQIEKKSDVIKIPNAALRFYPKLEQVREVDRKILEGEEEEKKEGESNSEEEPPAAERIKIGKEHNKRHVWVVDGDYLRAVRVTTGIDDYRYTELVSGDLKPGMKLVTGEEVKE